MARDERPRRGDRGGRLCNPCPRPQGRRPDELFDLVVGVHGFRMASRYGQPLDIGHHRDDAYALGERLSEIKWQTALGGRATVTWEWMRKGRKGERERRRT